MRAVTGTVVVAILLAAAPHAAAQDSAWVHEIEARVAGHAEAIARMVEQQVALAQGRDRQPDPGRAERERRAAERQRQRAEREQQREEAMRNWADVSEPFSRTVRVGRNGTVDLQNVGGKVVVTGRGGEDVRVEAVRRVRAANEADARAILRNVQVLVAERAGAVDVRTALPRTRNASVSVDYTVEVPNGANVTVRTVSGTLRVANVNGDVRAETVSATVNTSGLRRLRSVQSVSGAMEIVDTEGEDVSAGTVSGTLDIRNLKARTLELSSVSGNLRSSGVEADRVEVETVSGGVEYSGRLARNGRYEFQSHSGDVRILPVGDAGFEVEANTFSGTVRSDFALKIRQETERGLRRGTSRTLRGTFGNSGAVLSLQSFSGDLQIVRP